MTEAALGHCSIIQIILQSCASLPTAAGGCGAGLHESSLAHKAAACHQANSSNCFKATESPTARHMVYAKLFSASPPLQGMAELA